MRSYNPRDIHVIIPKDDQDYDCFPRALGIWVTAAIAISRLRGDRNDRVTLSTCRKRNVVLKERVSSQAT